MSINSLKRKFSELLLEDISEYKISRVEKVDKKIYKVKLVKKDDVQYCSVHSNFNSCMLYNCPGIKSSRYAKEKSITSDKYVNNKNNYDFYS